MIWKIVRKPWKTSQVWDISQLSLIVIDDMEIMDKENHGKPPNGWDIGFLMTHKLVSEWWDNHVTTPLFVGLCKLWFSHVLVAILGYAGMPHYSDTFMRVTLPCNRRWWWWCGWWWCGWWWCGWWWCGWCCWCCWCCCCCWWWWSWWWWSWSWSWSSSSSSSSSTTTATI